MKSVLAVTVFSLAACTADLELDLSHSGPEVDVFDDGSSLYIVGCSDEALFGCNSAPGSERMRISIGDETLEIAPDSETPDPVPAESILLLFDSGPFVALVPRQASSMSIELAGQQAEVALADGFEVRAPLTASRAQPIVIELERSADVETVDVLELVSCGDGVTTMRMYQPEQQTFTLDTLDALDVPAGATCEHEIRVSERRQMTGDLRIDARRVEVVTLTSTP